MFWNAFIWGLGVSCGGGIGLIGFVLTLWAAQWVTGKTGQVAEIARWNKLTLAALQTRNELTLESIDALRDISTSIDAITNAQAKVDDVAT